ncbi:MAG TPA: GNAT family N-acetyltransferase [Clostridia bacterium]|nr:GNAT family N-acetyltransferase [Clostridia bacterium]
MRIREAICEDASKISVVHVDTWRSTYDGIISSNYLNNLSYSKSEAMWKGILCDKKNDQFVYVLENDSKDVVGYVCGGKEREYGIYGEIYGIYIDKRYQRKGYGKKLFKKALEALTNRGYNSVIVWVLKDNPSYKFYEKLGGVRANCKEIKIGDSILIEVCYQWDNIHVLDI